MKKLVLTSLLLLAGSIAANAQQVILQTGQPQVVVQQQPTVVVQQAYCREYTDKFIIAGQERITRGTACLQPDGSWQLQPSVTGVNYVTRGNQVYVTPLQPFAGIVIEGHGHDHHRDHW